MSVLDQIAAEGGAAANFCDLGGGARADVVIGSTRRRPLGRHAWRHFW